MTPRWSARAAGQLLDAIAYLEDERPGTGRALRDAVEDLVELLTRFPRAFPLLPEAPGDEVRRALLPRWGYWLIFELRGDGELVLLAMWHSQRRPGGWQE